MSDFDKARDSADELVARLSLLAHTLVDKAAVRVHTYLHAMVDKAQAAQTGTTVTRPSREDMIADIRRNLESMGQYETAAGWDTHGTKVSDETVYLLWSVMPEEEKQAKPATPTGGTSNIPSGEGLLDNLLRGAKGLTEDSPAWKAFVDDLGKKSGPDAPTESE